MLECEHADGVFGGGTGYRERVASRFEMSVIWYLLNGMSHVPLELPFAYLKVQISSSRM